MSHYKGFLKSIFSESYHLCFFLPRVLKLYRSFKIIVLPAPSYKPQQQLFVETLTDYLRVIGRKLRLMGKKRINPLGMK